MTTAREQVVATAVATLHEHERPAGSNRTRFGRAYGGRDGEPWCAKWVWCIFMWALGFDLKRLTGAWAGTRFGLAAGIKAGWAVSPRLAQAGDIVFLNFKGGDYVDHVEIVVANTGAELRTIGGNVGNYYGGSVEYRVRQWNEIAGVLSPPVLGGVVNKPPVIPPKPSTKPLPPFRPSPQLPVKAINPEGPMLLVVDNVGFFSITPGPVIVALSMSEYAATVENSRNIEILRLPQGPGQHVLESTLKAMAKVVG